MGLLSQQYGKVVELPAGSTLCSPVFRGSSGCLDVGGQASRAVFKKNASYDTIELMGYGQELMMGSQGATLHINYRATTTCTPANWYWRCGTSSSFSHHYFGNVCSCSCLRGPVICGTTCVSTAQVIGTKVSVGSLNANYDLYNNGTTYLNGAVTIDDTVTAHRFKSCCRLWNTSSLASNNFFADSGASGGDGFALGQGTGILDIWVKDDSVSELRSVFRAYNQGSCIIIGRGCSANDNANIPVFMCKSLSVSRASDTQGIAIGCNYSNTGNWDSQLDIYGGGHSIIRINQGCGTDGANNSRYNCIYAHCGNPFVICSSGNIRLKPGTGTTISCGMFCAGCVCGVTCVYSNCVYANKIQADSCVKTGDLCLTEDYSGDMSNGIQLGRSNGLPQAAWGESGSKTGRIEIGLPTATGQGGANHWGMVHVAIDVYEYNSNDATTIIVGGHNWGVRWYNCGAHITGGCTDKSVKVAYHACGGSGCNGRYVILLGECDSTWSYGSVHVRSITNGLYYNGNMDVGTPWYVKRVTCPDSYYNQTSGNLIPGSYSMAGYQCAITCVHTPRVCATTCVHTSRVQAACLHSTGNICGEEICSGSWFRNETSGQGLYNSGNGFHFYATGTNNVRIYSANANNIGLQGYACGGGRGCLHFNCDNQIHLYDHGGTARFLINSTTDIRLCNTTCLHCNIYVGGRIFACNQSESINFKGARGCFTNQYMHLYNKVGIGHPNGWGCGETNTPDKGLSTYGKACIGYGTSASLSHLKVAGGVSTLGSRGLYSETNANCFYPDAAGTWNLQSASGQTHSSLRFRRGDGTIDGYVYSSTGGYIGILDSASYWAYGHQTNACHWWNISNATKMKLCANCLCHNCIICSACCVRSKAVYGSSWVCSGGNMSATTCLCTPVVCGSSCVFSCRFQHGWRGIAIGGDYDKFYPVSFTAKGGYNSEDILEIAQGNVHSPSSSCGAMYLKLGFNITGWGHISNHYVVHKYSTGGTNTLVSKIRAIDHSTCRIGVWLRGGGLTYHYRSREGTIACNITGSTTACCLSYDNSNNAYDVYVQYTSNVEDCNFGNQGGCNAGNAYLNHHSSLGTSVVLTTGNLQKALCCGCYTNTVCLGNCGVIKNTVFNTGVVCGNDCIRGGKVCGVTCVYSAIVCGGSFMNSCKFCTGATYLCNNCLHVSGGNICSGNAIYLSEWVRFNCACRGLYWAGACQYHIYPAACNHYMYFRTSASATGIIMTTDNNTTPRGYFYANNSNNIGILDKDGNWAIRHCGDNGTYWSINNSEKMKLTTSCLCHNGVICAASVIKSGDWVCGNRVCGGTFYGNGSGLTNVPGGNPDHYCAENDRIRIGRCNMTNISTTQNYSLGSCIMTCVQSSTSRNNITIGHDIANYTSAAANGLCYNTFIGAMIARKGCCNLQNNIVIGYQAGYNMGHASSKAAGQNVVVGSYAGSNYSSTFTGCENTFLGTQSGYRISTGCKNTGVGNNAGRCVTTGSCNVFLGFCSGCGHTTGTGYSYVGSRCGCCVVLCGNTSVCGSLSKSSGCFKIAHPNPAKRDSYDLVHSFVESPTEGDNIYRYTTETTSCRSVIELPDYYSYLNKNDQVWVSANKHFGVGYGEVTEDQKCLVVCSCCDGIYNVLLIGTRKDNDAVRNWNGPEIKLKHPDRDIVDR